jgi:hypothetical protein
LSIIFSVLKIGYWRNFFRSQRGSSAQCQNESGQTENSGYLIFTATEHRRYSLEIDMPLFGPVL